MGILIKSILSKWTLFIITLMWRNLLSPASKNLWAFKRNTLILILKPFNFNTNFAKFVNLFPIKTQRNNIFRHAISYANVPTCCTHKHNKIKEASTPACFVHLPPVRFARIEVWKDYSRPHSQVIWSMSTFSLRIYNWNKNLNSK